MSELLFDDEKDIARLELEVQLWSRVCRIWRQGRLQSSQNNLCIHVMGLYDLAKKWEKIGGNLCVLITLR